MKSSLKPCLAVATLATLLAASSAFAASAAENFDNSCAKCHGADGKAQSKMGKKLKVRDMTTEEYKKELDDAKALAVLKEGIKRDGKEVKKSFAAEFTDEELKALIAHVRTLK